MSYKKRVCAFSKKAIIGFVGIATFLSMTCAPFMAMTPVAKAQEPQFFTTNMFPSGGGANTTLAGEICFNTAVNTDTDIAGTNVYVLAGLKDDYKYFDPNSPDYMDGTALTDANISGLIAAVGTNPNCINIGGTLLAGTTYTTVAKNVCMAGHTTSEANFQEYCSMSFMSFTTAAGEGAAAASLYPGPDVPSNFLDGSKVEYFFPGDTNQGIFKFNIYGTDTLSQVKVCALSSDAYSIVEKVSLYRDKTSSTDSNGNHILEPGIDVKLSETTTWAVDGSTGNHCATLTVSPALTLPTENPNGSLGFIAFDFSDSANLDQYLIPFFVADSFILDDATVNGHMDTAILEIGSKWGRVQIITNAGQLFPYIQNLAPAEAIGPITDVTALGLDFWHSSATLSSLIVDIVVPSGGNFDPAYGLNTLSVDSESGVKLYRDDGDSAGQWDTSDTLVALSSAPTWQTLSGFTKRTVLTLQTPQSQPTTNPDTGADAGPDYFVRVKTSSSPAPGESFQVRIPKDGFVTGFPETDVPSSSINIQSGGGPAPSGLVISEVQTGAGDNDFIELYNPTNASVNLNGYCLVSRAADELTTDATIKEWSADAFVPAYGFYLWANSEYTGISTAADVTSAATLDNNMGIALRQEAGGTIIDSVAWGDVITAHAFKEGEAASNPSANNSIERKSWPNATAADMAANGMDEKMGNGEDSNNNFMDFVSQTITTLPQSTVSDVEDPNSATEGGGDNATPVVINEVFYNIATKGGWIELFNRTSTAEDIATWTIAASGQTYTFPASSSISPDGYVIVHWNNAEIAANSGNNFYSNITGSAQVSADMSKIAGDVILKNGSSTIKDYVQYGGPGQANETSGASAVGAIPPEWVVNEFVPNAMYGQSIGRNSSSGADSNRASDWQTFSSLTQGTVNSGGDSFPPDPVISVELEDEDITYYGIDGRDATVSWTRATANDPTFDKYEIYLLPSGTAFSASTHTSITDLYGDQNTQTWTGGPGNTYDSVGDALATGNYRAYVIATDLSGNSSSAAVSAIGELASGSDASGQDDTNPPMMMHSPISTIQSGQTIQVVARFGDDRATIGGTPLLTGKVNYSFTNDGTAWGNWASIATDVGDATITDLGNGYYQFNVGWQDSAIGFKYYLDVNDAVNITYMSASPIADETDSDNSTTAGTGNAKYNSGNPATPTSVQAAPFVVNIEASGSFDNTISGYVYNSSDIALIADNVKVSIIGLSLAAVGVNTSGFYTFGANVPDGSYTLQAIATDYMSMDIGPINVSGDDPVDSTLNNFYLNSGQSGGGIMSGDMDNPFVIWTTPFDGSTSASLDISSDPNACPITIGFSEAMDPNTIIDGDTSNFGSNIYLTTNGLDRIQGSISYNLTTHEATFTSGTSLSPSTGYALVVTPGVMDEAGNTMMGNQKDGAYVVSFQTMIDTAGSDYGGDYDDYYVDNYGKGGAMMPPYVVGTVPSPGAFNVTTNSVISIEFSEPMLVSSIVATAGQTTAGTIQLLRITSLTDYASVNVPIIVALDNQTSKIATITPVDAVGSAVGSKIALDQNVAQEGWYQIVVSGAVQSNTGAYMGDPGSGGNTAGSAFYTCDFQVNYTAANEAAAQDTVNPTVLGSYPSADNTGIEVNIPVIDIGFSEPMTTSTISGSAITLKAGSSSVAGSVEYDPMGNSARFMPSSVLSANTLYTLTVTTDAEDLAGRALLQTGSNASSIGNYVITFTTGPADSTLPTVLYANADDYQIALTFSEAMNTAKATASAALWAASVLNPANYFVNSLRAVECDVPGSWSCNPSLMAPYATVGGTQVSGLTGISISYDSPSMTVTLKGFSFANSTDGFQIFVDNVTDKANNVLSDDGKRLSDTDYRNAARAPMQNSADTYGMLGPGGGGMMMMGPMGGGGMGGGGPMPSSSMGPGMDMGIMGMMGGGVMPMNMMAGQTSMYFVDLPVTKSIPVDGTIILTFPSGFNVASALPDDNSPLNDDINEWAAGTVGFTLDKDQTSRTITLTITGSPTLAADFLHLDLKGIVNSPIPKGFGTSGYTVDIKTMSSDGALLENITTMPFYIQEAGAYALSGTITMKTGDGLTDVDITDAQTMTIFLGSPMTGPMEATVTFDGDNNADYLFAGLPEGEYFLFTDPLITVNVGSTATDFEGLMMPEPIRLTTSATKDLTIKKMDDTAATDVTVTLIGDFRTAAGNNADIDIFASSPSGFRVRTISLGNTTGTDEHLFLPAGDWMVGIGPAMPKGAMSGPPQMPDWMPPMPTRLNVSGSGIASLTIDISGQENYQILGQVINDSGTGIANAEVWAFNPMGGMGGAHTKTDASGNFTLKVGVLGFYQVGAHKPGLPGGREQTVEVRTGGAIWLGGFQIITNANFQIVLQQPAWTISGKVLNSSSQAVAYAPVWAWQSNGYGHSDTMTDSSGNYILYVDNGTWYIETDAPGVGWLQYDLPVVVSGASQSSINLKPATDVTFYDISGTISINGSLQQYMPLRASLHDCTNGAYLGRDFGGITDSSGDYTISVPGPGTGDSQVCYRIDSWTSDYGEIAANELDNDGVPNEGYEDDDMVNNNPANVLITNANVSDVDILIAAGELKSIALTFTNGTAAQEGFVKIKEVIFADPTSPVPTGFYRSLRITDLNAGDTVKLRDGYYQFSVDVPGLGFYIPDTSSRDDTYNCVIVTGVSGTQTVNFDLPDLAAGAGEVVTYTANVTDASGTVLSDAWFWVSNPITGFNTGCSTTSGACTVTVPSLVFGDYKIGADKPGYMSAESTTKVGNLGVTVDVALTVQGNVISGYICDDANNDYVCATSERIPNGWIKGEDIDTGKMSYAPVDGNGFFELGVSNGNWKVYGSANSYLETQYSENGADVILNVSGSDLTGRHLPLASDSNFVVKTKSKTMKPSSGGTIDDTGSDGTGVKVTIPPQALGSSTSNGSISVTETSAVSATNSAEPFAGKGKEILATDNSNQPINSLSDYIDVEMNITKTEIDIEVASGALVDMSTLEPLQMSYWDDTIQNWTSLPTDKEAYYKVTEDDTEWTLYRGNEDDKTDMEEFIEDALVGTSFVEGTDFVDYKLVLTASTNHLTVFGATGPKDGLSPSAPAGLTQISGSGTSVGLSWTWDATNTDTTACVDFAGYEVYRCAVSGTCDVVGDYTQLNSANIAQNVLTFTDNAANSTSAPAAFTSYYYIVSAGDTSGNETYSSTASSALQVCSTNTVSNGTVATNCAITCNTGYNLSGNECVAVSGTVVVPSTPSTSTTPTTPSPTVSMPTTITGEVTATAVAGGKTTITTSENIEASVRLPANAVSTSTEVSIAPVSVAETTVDIVVSSVAAIPVGNSIVGGYAYNITATSDGAAVTTFEKYITIILNYKTSQISGLKESTLAINYWDETAVEWVALDTSVDKATNTLTAQTLHFTYFAIMGEEGEDEPEAEPAPITEMTDAQIRARIAEITILIAQLQAQLNELLGISVEDCTITSFDRTLKKGMSGDDVKCLQIILNSASDTRVAETGVGSSGNETKYFGSLTKAAVIKFQEKYAPDILASWNLTSGTGLVGTTTRDKLNSLIK